MCIEHVGQAQYTFTDRKDPNIGNIIGLKMKRGTIIIRSAIIAGLVAMLFDPGTFLYPMMWSHVVAIVVTLFIFGFGIFSRTGHAVSAAILPVCCWGAYVAIYSLLGTSEMYVVTFLLASCLLFYGTYRLSVCDVITATFSRRVVVSCAIIEAVVCIAQWAGILPGASSLFAITGTFENPNISAMVIALAWPCAIGESLRHKDKRVLWCMVIILLFISLLLLRCRTAYLCMGFSLWILRHSVPRISEFIEIHKKTMYPIAVAVVAIAGYFMYEMKKDSADGRLFIWKVSSQMLMERPMSGYGYGLFGATYNPYQIDYTEKKPLSETEAQNIRIVNMPYNEFVEQSLNGGIVGGILFMMIPIYAIVSAYRRKQWIEVAVSGNILIMSLFNFVAQAIPLWILYMFLLGQQMRHVDRPLPVKFSKCINIAAFACFVFCIGSICPKIIAQYQLKNAIVLYKECPQKAMELLDRYRVMAGSSECYLRCYGKMLLDNGRYKEALPILEEAARYTYHPDLNKDIIKAKSIYY